MTLITRLAGLGLIGLALVAGGIPAAGAHERGHRTDSSDTLQPVYHRSFKGDKHQRHHWKHDHRDHDRRWQFRDRHYRHHGKHYFDKGRHYGGRRHHDQDAHHKHKGHHRHKPRWSVYYGYY